MQFLDLFFQIASSLLTAANHLSLAFLLALVPCSLNFSLTLFVLELACLCGQVGLCTC